MKETSPSQLDWNSLFLGWTGNLGLVLDFNPFLVSSVHVPLGLRMGRWPSENDRKNTLQSGSQKGRKEYLWDFYKIFRPKQMMEDGGQHLDDPVHLCWMPNLPASIVNRWNSIVARNERPTIQPGEAHTPTQASCSASDKGHRPFLCRSPAGSCGRDKGYLTLKTCSAGHSWPCHGPNGPFSAGHHRSARSTNHTNQYQPMISAQKNTHITMPWMILEVIPVSM